MKILTYNTPIINRQIQNKIAPKQFLVDGWETIFDECKCNNFSTNYYMYDRTGAIPHFLNIDETYSKIPNGYSNKSFKQIAEERAKYIVGLGKPINVSWSGGIDSTFVLFCMYNYAVDKEQITVYGTYNSVIESGYMFDRYIKNRVNYKIKINSLYKNNFEGDGLYVTGALSNQLFQPGVKYSYTRDTILGIKDTKFIEQNCLRNIEDVIDDKILDFLKPSLDKFPVRIKTLQELRWFINFNFCWYNNSTHHKIAVSNRNVISFFDTEEFQLWSIHNTDHPTKTGDYNDERWQIRELIQEYTGDKLYAKNKRKNTSVLSSLDENWLFLLNDYSNIYIDDLQ